MLDALISAGANLLGNLLNKGQSDKNMEMQQQFNAQQLALGRENMAMQKEFAQHGISWKVQDAIAAGLHPLIGAGAQAQSFSPVSVGGSAPQSTSNFDFSSLGQDLSRAAKAMSSEAQREAVDQRTQRRLELESLQLDNDIKRAAIASRSISTSRRVGQLGPAIGGSDVPPGSWSAHPPIAHLSRSPERNVFGEAVKGKDIEQAHSPVPEYKWHRPLGYPLMRNPYFDDAQVTENAWGDAEAGNTAKWVLNAIADHGYTAWKGLDWNWRGGDRSRYRRRGFNN